MYWQSNKQTLMFITACQLSAGFGHCSSCKFKQMRLQYICMQYVCKYNTGFYLNISFSSYWNGPLSGDFYSTFWNWSFVVWQSTISANSCSCWNFKNTASVKFLINTQKPLHKGIFFLPIKKKKKTLRTVLLSHFLSSI